MAKTQGRILVVDDDENLIQVISMRLESANYEVVAKIEEDEAIDAVREQSFDLAIIDLQLAHSDGISLMEEIHHINPELPAIILTAYGSIESAVDAMRRGAYSYLTKPFDPRELLLQIEKALDNRRLYTEVRRLQGLLEEKHDFSNIVAKSDRMKKVLEQVSLIAKTDSTIYIYGESGTGKELIATAIHLASARKDNPFVAINCAAIPESLMESELFGYEKGAFTGAVRNTNGLFYQAHKGTIFLDEISSMPLSIQAKMLRVLQERQFYPVGGKSPVEVDVRIIAATNRDLEEEVKNGTFREDLFYRIHVIPVELPPLRDKKEDIPPLVELFIRKFNDKMKKKVKGLTPGAMQKLMIYDWPGNVRELENTIEFAMAMTQHDVITEDLILQTRGKISEPVKSFKSAKDMFEKSYLINVLTLTKGNVSKAAEIAGKYRADFYALLKKHDIKPEVFKGG